MNGEGRLCGQEGERVGSLEGGCNEEPSMFRGHGAQRLRVARAGPSSGPVGQLPVTPSCSGQEVSREYCSREA